MGLFDELKKLTQPYDDEDDFYEGADGAFKAQAPISDAQAKFENTFADEQAGAPEPASGKGFKSGGVAGSIFGNLGSASPRESSKPAKSPSRLSRRSSSSGSDQSVIRFNPKDFDEAGNLVNYLEQGRSLIMSLEDIPNDMARRLLDFMSGIAFAVDGKITPVSAKTYFVTPENVDLLDADNEKSDSEPEEESDY